MGTDSELQLIDYLLLDQVKSSGIVNDHLLSGQLHCPRTFLLNRLERLLAEGYLTQEAGTFALTDQGLMAWMPLDYFCLAAQPQEEPPKTFSWDTEIYIPRPEWSDE